MGSTLEGGKWWIWGVSHKIFKSFRVLKTYVSCLGWKLPSLGMDAIHNSSTPWGYILPHLCWFNFVQHNKMTGGVTHYHDWPQPIITFVSSMIFILPSVYTPCNVHVFSNVMFYSFYLDSMCRFIELDNVKLNLVNEFFKIQKLKKFLAIV
jgi:hypothetical protein